MIYEAHGGWLNVEMGTRKNCFVEFVCFDSNHGFHSIGDTRIYLIAALGEGCRVQPFFKLLILHIGKGTKPRLRT